MARKRHKWAIVLILVGHPLAQYFCVFLTNNIYCAPVATPVNLAWPV